MLGYRQISKESCLETELVKVALERYTKDKNFEEGTLCNKEIAWYLKTIFSFEIIVEDISKSNIKILVRNGLEIRCLDFAINIV